MDRNHGLEAWFVYSHVLGIATDTSIGGNAVISLIFAEYVNRIFLSHTREEVSPDDSPQWAIKLTAVGAVLVVTILCVAARKLGTRIAVVFTTAKVSQSTLL